MDEKQIRLVPRAFGGELHIEHNLYKDVLRVKCRRTGATYEITCMDLLIEGFSTRDISSRAFHRYLQARLQSIYVAKHQ